PADQVYRRRMHRQRDAARPSTRAGRLGARGMILDERRVGGVLTVDATDPRLRIPAFWRALDRNISLGVKLVVPVMVITLIGTGGFGLIEAQQTNQQVEASYETGARSAAAAAATAF